MVYQFPAVNLHLRSSKILECWVAGILDRRTASKLSDIRTTSDVIAHICIGLRQEVPHTTAFHVSIADLFASTLTG